jgi:cation diffusion facilitator CzcD-associated flavoprotein CzcO
MGTAQYQTHVRVAIAGTGFAGIGMAIRLQQEGIHDFVLLERAADFGGTWRDNSYPGCRCDVPSHLYSFSFEPNPDWSESFSQQPEIEAYLVRTAEKHGLRAKTRFEHEVLGAQWDAARQRWAIETSQGPLTADVLVSGMGALSDPAIPEIPGLERFRGATFHSATWDHDYDLRGKRVAVVGTGASAIQFVPKIQPLVERLDLYQRTPPWILPRRDRAISAVERRLYRLFPPLQRLARWSIYWGRETFVVGFRHPRVMQGLERVAKRYLASQVPDRELRRKLAPSYRLGCKRVLISNDYLPSLTRPNVEVTDAGIERITERGVVAGDGTEREVDAIIFGTGFQVTDVPASHRLRGADGRTLAEHWNGSMQAHRGTMVAGFPNFFFLLGPNTGLGHTSVVFMIESQIEYVLDCLRAMGRAGAAEVEPRAEAQAAFNERVQRQMRGTVWTHGGCRSWYLDRTGRNTTLWPGFTFAFRHELARFTPAEHVLRTRRAALAREPVAA